MNWWELLNHKIKQFLCSHGSYSVIGRGDSTNYSTGEKRVVVMSVCDSCWKGKFD